MSRQPASSDTADRLALPRSFGNYVLFDRIGAGGMAEIFLARSKTQSGVGRLAVVKLVLPQLASDERFSGLLVQEAKLAAQLSHGNIVQTFDLGRQDGRLFIAMEYVEGFDLNDLLKRCSKARVPLPAEYALCIIAEVLRALEYAHRKKDSAGNPLGIVHRDVSPSNVLVSFEGEIKLCDFGIARALNTEEAPNDAIEGKASYMAPEHARGDSIDSRADIFSVSVILWELLAGRRLYKPGPGVDLLAMARAANIPELPERPLPEFDRLRAIVRKGLARSPADRYPTALAMVRELDDYLHSAKLIASPLDLGGFVVDHFGQEILELRAQRERLAIEFEQPAAESVVEESTQEHFAPPSQGEGEGEGWDRDTNDDLKAPVSSATGAPLPIKAAPTTARPESRESFDLSHTPGSATSGSKAIPLPLRAKQSVIPQGISSDNSTPPSGQSSPFSPATMTAPIPLMNGAEPISPESLVSAEYPAMQSEQPPQMYNGPQAPMVVTEPPSVGARLFALLFGAVIVLAIGLVLFYLRRH